VLVVSLQETFKIQSEEGILIAALTHMTACAQVKMGSSLLLTHENPKIIYCSKSRLFRTEYPGVWHYVKGNGNVRAALLSPLESFA